MIRIAELTQPQVNKLRKLKPPHEFKNYKELCKYIKIKPVGGNKKKSILKEIEQYVDLSVKGYKIIIKSIKPEIEKKPDNRKQTLYGERFETLLLDHGVRTTPKMERLKDDFYEYKKERNSFVVDTAIEDFNKEMIKRTIYITPRQMMFQFNMTNANYHICEYHTELAAKFFDVDLDILTEFFKATNGHFYRIIKSTLENLEKKNIFSFKNHRIIISPMNDHYPASDHMNLLIMKKEMEALADMEYEKYNHVIISNNVDNFKNLVVKKVNEVSNEKIQSFYNAYKLEFLISPEEDGKYSEFMIKELKKEVNNIIKETLKINVENRHKKQRQQINHENKKKNTNYRAESNYIEQYEGLINIFLDPNTKSYKDEFKYFREEEYRKRKIEEEEEKAFILQLLEL